MKKKILSGAILLNFFACNFGTAQIIEDEVAQQAFAGKNLTRPVYQKPLIEDGVVQQAFEGKTFYRPGFKAIMHEDKYINDKFVGKKYEKPAVHYKIIDENSQIVKISVHSAKVIDLKKEPVKLNQRLDFRVVEDVYRGGEIFIKKDTPVNAVVELVSKSDRFGDPQELELGRFSIKDVKGAVIELDGCIRKEGANRGKWAKPLYYAGLSASVFGTPLLLCYFVKGGKVKISPAQKFDFYYEAHEAAQ